jgi:hypothetical protein
MSKSTPAGPRAPRPSSKRETATSGLDPYSRAEANELIWGNQIDRGDFDHLFTDPGGKVTS